MPPSQQGHTGRFIETSTSRERVKAFVPAINQHVRRHTRFLIVTNAKPPLLSGGCNDQLHGVENE
jgi:hypothetical protein